MDLEQIIDPLLPISLEMDATHLQESAAYRSLARAKRIAEYLISDEAVMDLALLDPLIAKIENNLYSILPAREMDAIFLKHTLACLKILKSDKELRRLLFSIDRPEGHKKAEEMIQRACGLESKAGLTKAHARRAALSAWLTLLRQNVGSCFATAPALLIQQEAPRYLFKDINDLFGMGRLKRVVGGNEHNVPLSQSFGIGDLRKPVHLTEETLRRFAKAPGIILAFEAAAIKKNILQLLLKSFEKKLNSYQTVTVEDILRKSLLTHLEITEADIAEFELRSKPYLPFGIVDWSAKGGLDTQSTGERCAHFFGLLENAKNAFVSLTDHPVLKAWEFTIASFCETQSDFAKWNLYSSLGLDPQEKGGLGQVLYQAVSMFVERSNQKMLSIQDEYKTAWLLLQGVETKINNAASEQELRWIRADYMSKKNEFNTLEELRDRESARGQKLANLLQFIIDNLVQLFPKYFQEVYDPELKEVVSGPYDDAPCGFRLMYKHGRQNSSAWTFVRTYQEFVDALNSFFNAFEVEFNRNPSLAGIEKEFTEAITQMSMHIRTEEFILTAFSRMAKVHNSPIVSDPLHNLDKIPKKPWAYTSGGTMGTLISNYFSREEKPAEQTVWVESTQELLLFLEDTMKKVPYKEAEKFLHHPCKSFLIHSPTHAFRFMPGLSPFNKAWQDRQYTYTFVRDKYVEPAKKFYHMIRLDQEMIRALLNEIKSKVHENYFAAYDLVFRLLPRSLAPDEFYTYFMQGIHQDRTLATLFDYILPKEEIESLLFANIPYIRRYHIEEKAMEILEPFCRQNLPQLQQVFAELMPNPPEVLASKDFYHLLLNMIRKIYNNKAQPQPIREQLIEAMEIKELRPPPPIFFADSNWQNDYFAFLVSPATLNLEFWRMTPFSFQGAPMSIWKRYLDGTVKHPPWGIYTDKTNYM